MEPTEQTKTGLDGIPMPPTRKHIETIAQPECLGKQLGSHDLLFSPDHQILERRVDSVAPGGPGVDNIAVVQKSA